MNLRRSRESRTRTGSGRLVKAVAWVGVASLVLGWVVDRAWGQGGPAGSGRMTSASNLVDRMPLSSPPAAMGGGELASRRVRSGWSWGDHVPKEPPRWAALPCRLRAVSRRVRRRLERQRWMVGAQRGRRGRPLRRSQPRGFW